MIAVDTLVHNFLHRTGILHRLDASHAYGPACYHGCPVEFWWTRRMALILLFSERLTTCRDTEGDRRHAASE
jgi:hypothetical protein